VVAKWFVALAAGLTAAATLAAQAPAARQELLSCSGQQATFPFLRWLDPIPYVRVPGGDFESSHGWQLSGGASVVSGNQPWGAGSRSLYLPPGASATSPETCVAPLALTMRYFAANSGSALAPLKVEILYTTADGRRRSATVGGRLGGNAWSPGLLPTVYLLAHLGPLLRLDDGLATKVAFRFSSQQSLLGGGRWRVDDVYVDPWASGL
jgi:hypothetical protein